MRKVLLSFCFLLAGTASTGRLPEATTTSFSSLDVPGASWTEARGVLRVGPLLQYAQVVGSFHDTRGTHGFLWTRGRFTTVDYPGARNTWTTGINRHGQIVGEYAGSDGVVRGFRYSAGTYTTLTCPLNRGSGPANIAPNGINDAGVIVGDEGPAGLAYVQGSCVFAVRQNELSLNGINDDGVAAATIVDSSGAIHGESLLPLAANENAAPFDVPGASATWATGINGAGTIAGFYRTGNRFFRSIHGYVDTNGTFTTLDYPGAFRTEPFALDDAVPPTGAYDVVGYYGGLFGAHHGFIATLAPQAVSEP